MQIQERVPLAPKTTMRIGGCARYYAELSRQSDVEIAWKFAQEKGVPMIALGSGSNTVFADGTIDALVVRVVANGIDVSGNIVRAEAGAPLATVITQLAKRGLDFSALTGIPGTVGGAIFGNAGQGPQGTWLDHYVQTVSAFVEGEWKIFSRKECDFRYRDSVFKRLLNPLLWKVTLTVPSRPAQAIEREITMLLKKRAVAQPFTRTAGSCFKAFNGTPAWKIIDAAGLKGLTIGDLQVSEKHANFLVNKERATFADVRALIKTIRERTNQPLELEMRLIEESGSLLS
ncbi:hypothetical protein AUJ46_03340 [Candidatus Peregrinibacteria bacterium CG1_02_54_53]|nr:MAG: hypothetical protein AUJ46_03340 [Candidatus Peregrinibacteria bacterium CG1_02_54_53]